MNNQLKPRWKTMKFGDIAENIAIRVKPSEADTDIYVGLEHLDPESLHLKKWGHPSDVEGDKLRFWKGDIVFGRRRAYQRKLAIADFDGICSAHAIVLRAKPENIRPDFLPFFLQSDMFMERAIGISVGSLSPTINWKTLREEEFPLPPLQEQKRIAEILWEVDETLEKYNDVTKNLKTIKSKFIYELVSQAKTSASERLCSYITLEYGDSLPESKRQGSKYPVMGSNGIVGFHDEYKVEGPGVIVGRKGGAGEVTWFEKACWPIDTTYFVNIHNSMIDIKYVYYLLKGLKLQRYAITTSIPGLSRNDVNSIRVRIPRIDRQKDIVRRLGSIENADFNISEHKKKIENTKDKLLVFLIRGDHV